ncbi:MAG: Cell division protein FtsZ [candidate division TM6 bacterium GW2011_GWF2_32_72]|nr:MAG: Cell division protein FtsZ [candidate division TM6 bacterium GW2011_GWF2_32_72]
MIELDMTTIKEAKQEQKKLASIKVVGVGGAGGNTVNSMLESDCGGIDYILINSDLQALERSNVKNKIQVGVKSTKGLGTGANPELGKKAAEEDLEKVMTAIGDAEIVFLTAGMGGGTGSGALPVIAEALHERGILSVAVVTKPFVFEGKRRSDVAESAIKKVREFVDTLIIVPNQRLLDVVEHKVSMLNAFSMINDVLIQSVRGISDIITKSGHINVDFADVRAIMKDMGLAVLGTGRASGPDRAFDATMQAISSPLLENMSIEGAHGVLINITGSADLGLHEISEAASLIYEQAAKDANIILGSVIDESLKDEIQVTVIATGFEKDLIVEEVKAAPAKKVTEVKEVSFIQERNIQEKVMHDEIKKTYPERTSTDIFSVQSKEKMTADIVDVELKSQTTAKEIENLEIDMDDLDIPTFMREDQGSSEL